MKEKKAKPIENKRIRKGDKVIAISGNYKGMTGTVLSRSEDRVVIEGINVRKKHLKGQKDRPGQIVEMEKPIHISNVKACSAENKPVKLRVRLDEKGERQLYYVDGKDVLHRQIKKS
jgi:large subunit ribosomal protein L24